MDVSHRILNVPKSVLQLRSFKQPGALSQPLCSNSLMADQWHHSQCWEHQTDRNISKLVSPACIMSFFFFIFLHLKSKQPGSGAPDVQALRARCDRPNQMAAEKFIHQCQPAHNTKGPQRPKNTGVNILQLLKAIPGRHPYFIHFSSYFEISLWVICFGYKKSINIWVFISTFLSLHLVMWRWQTSCLAVRLKARGSVKQAADSHLGKSVSRKGLNHSISVKLDCF